VANIVFNIAKGRITELYSRVENNDPANAAFVLVPIETTGLEADAVLIDVDTLTALVAGTTNEQTTMGRKTLTDVDLAALPAPDDTNDRYSLNLPSVTWTAAAGNAISKIAVCYDNDTTGGTDANIIPLTMFDFVMTPSGADITMTGGEFFRAS
jgi:hypothetical protein